MKLLSLVLSVVMFFVSLYWFIIKISSDRAFFMDDYIYVAILVVLIFICITGIMINSSYFTAKKRKSAVLFVSNTFSKRKK